MEASIGGPARILVSTLEPDTEKIKRKLFRVGVFPTPKIVHTLRKKEIQKSIRQSKRIADKNKALGVENPLSESQRQVIAEEALFQDISREYKTITRYLKANPRPGDKTAVPLVGLPWESSSRSALRELESSSKEYSGEKVKEEHLEEFRQILSHRHRSSLRWLLDDDIEERCCPEYMHSAAKRRGGEADAIRLLVNRLSSTDLSWRDWKFSRLMGQSGLQFTERHLLHIVEGLGAIGCWKHALSVVEWVYNRKNNKCRKSRRDDLFPGFCMRSRLEIPENREILQVLEQLLRFVFTKLLEVLGKGRRTSEALGIFNMMREDGQTYPDMPAYHSIAVTLGQAGFVQELLSIIECMKQKPSRKMINMHRKNWDPSLEPDLVVYNAVLNACVPSCHWKGVSWVLEQMRKHGIKPNGATYGLAMEVMLQSGKYDHVHYLFEKMKRSGEAPKSLTYRVLVRTFWEECKVDEAIEAVRDMEQRGVIGTASVYYELACCLCHSGRWQDAMVMVEKLNKLSLTKPLEVAFTGMIVSSMDGGHISDCMSIFEHMKEHCAPNIGTINVMLKVYGRNDMFVKAKELFEQARITQSCFSASQGSGSTSLNPDAHTYSSMLEASAHAYQWEYFENVYKQMTLGGYQLDQNKHASLLVEASRAGKWHLLEHAFDRYLDMGEVPHPLLFTEMICQAIACHNYEKAVGLVNSMAYTSFQTSEQQWVDVLWRNRDRMSKYGLQKMLDTVRKTNIASKATVSNLLKSLESLCESSASEDSLGVTTSSDAVNDELSSRSGDVKLDASENGKMQNCSVNKVVGQTTLYKYLLDTNTGDESAIPVQHTGMEICIKKNGSLCDKLEDSTSSMSSKNGSFRNRNSTSIIRADSKDSTIGMVLDLLTSPNEDVDSHGTDLPSVSEVLEAWKVSRKSDGSCFPVKKWL